MKKLILILVLIILNFDVFSQNNFQLTFTNKNKIEKIKILKIQNDTIVYQLRKMIIKTPLDSISEIKKFSGGVKNGFKNGFVLGLTIGLVYGAIVIAPNQETMEEMLISVLKTSLTVGSISSVFGSIYGLLTDDEIFDLQNLELEKKKEIVNNILE